MAILSTSTGLATMTRWGKRKSNGKKEIYSEKSIDSLATSERGNKVSRSGFLIYRERIFDTETPSSQRSEYFLIKNFLFCVLSASAVSRREALISSK